MWKDVAGTRTNFLYSDEGLIGEYDVTGSEIKTFGWLPDSVWGTNPLFLKQNGSYYWYHNDSAGTPQRMVRANGSTVWAATYDSFGNAQVSIEQIANPFRFSGQYFDAETGLHYNLNRYYDPAIGRYMRVDPVGDGLNLYAYCYNNPTGFVDPMGLCAASGALSGVHNALAVAGLIPGLGIIPDLLDGLLYLYEGDYSNAAMSGVAAVPLLGQFARAAWFANKAAKMANAYDLAKTAARYGDEAADAMRRASPPCFVAGTLVQTSEGLKPIEEIEPDDYVLSRDEQTGEMEYKRVVRAFVTPDQAVIELNLEGENGNTETIGATAEHPFWVKARGWVGAGELLPGDEVFTSTGGWLKVTGSTWLSGRQTVYNLEVEGFHTYFVGDVGVWVHNMCAMEASKSVAKKPSIKWDQYSQRWRDTATGQYTKGPKMPKGFGKPSTWKEGTKDVTNEMISTKKGQEVYEKMRDSSVQDDFAGAFEQALKDILKNKK